MRQFKANVIINGLVEEIGVTGSDIDQALDVLNEVYGDQNVINVRTIVRHEVKENSYAIS